MSSNEVRIYGAGGIGDEERLGAGPANDTRTECDFVDGMPLVKMNATFENDHIQSVGLSENRLASMSGDFWKRKVGDRDVVDSSRVRQEIIRCRFATSHNDGNVWGASRLFQKIVSCLFRSV